ncbi:hypothetical protein DOY81_015642, partial [Sarcophaga bullata]
EINSILKMPWLFLNAVTLNLALKNAEDNAPTKRDPASSDLLLEGEQPSLEEIRSWGHSFDKLMKSPSE